MKKVWIVLGVIAIVIGFILFFCWLIPTASEFRFNEWKKYADYYKGENK